MPKREEIRIRDPFILTDFENGCYYMYGTTALDGGSLHAGCTFSVYKSYDLMEFEGPKVIFDGERIGFWADRDFWAPEVHKYGGRYYLFGSCKAEGKCRATHILVCDTPDGEYLPVSDKPITPEGWECLDGTLYIEEGTPYIVFCHEWLQVKDGEIWAMELSRDLTHAVSEPFMLFRASDNPNVSELEPGSGNYVTDGPFLYHDGDKLRMIWSSFYRGRYLVLDAESDSIRGEWVHGGSRFGFDGGHAMIFTDLDGKRKISLHSPNKSDLERAAFYDAEA
ncbi:MAG: family 43 glycosylhydrolase [Clostridia bacterium]|nr:family 43 glycosylhydrolase [Clostridia bacterium]